MHVGLHKETYKCRLKIYLTSFFFFLIYCCNAILSASTKQFPIDAAPECVFVIKLFKKHKRMHFKFQNQLGMQVLRKENYVSFENLLEVIFLVFFSFLFFLSFFFFFILLIYCCDIILSASILTLRLKVKF